MYYCPGCAVASQKLSFVTQHIELTYLHQLYFVKEGCGRAGCSYCIGTGKHAHLTRSDYSQEELQDNVFGQRRKEEQREALKQEPQEESSDFHEQSENSGTNFSSDSFDAEDNALSSLPVAYAPFSYFPSPVHNDDDQVYSSSSSSSSLLPSSSSSPFTTRASNAPPSNFHPFQPRMSSSSSPPPRASRFLTVYRNQPNDPRRYYQPPPSISVSALLRGLDYALPFADDLANAKLQDLLHQMREKWYVEVNRQAHIVEAVTRAVHEVFGSEAEIGLFGSNLFGLQVPLSDINLEIKVTPRLSPEQEREYMYEIHRFLSEYLPAVLLDGTRLKAGIVEMRYFRPLNVPLANFIQQAFEADRRAVGLAMLVKTWVKHRALDMCLDGVVWTLLVLHSLQTSIGGPVICAPVPGSQKRPPSKNQDSLISLLFGFFERYSVGALIPPEYFSGPHKPQIPNDGTVFEYEISLKDGVFRSPEPGTRSLIIMRHPCDPSLNLTQSVSQDALDVVHAECARAAVLVASLMNLTQASAEAFLEPNSQAQAIRQRAEDEELAAVMRQLFEKVPLHLPSNSRSAPREERRGDTRDYREGSSLRSSRKRGPETRTPADAANYQRCTVCSTDVQAKDWEIHCGGKRHQANLGKRPKLAQDSAVPSSSQSDFAAGQPSSRELLVNSASEQSLTTSSPTLESLSVPASSAIVAGQPPVPLNDDSPATASTGVPKMDTWFCEVCKIHMQPSSARQHLAGKKHAKEVNGQQAVAEVCATYQGAPRPKRGSSQTTRV